MIEQLPSDVLGHTFAFCGRWSVAAASCCKATRVSWDNDPSIRARAVVAVAEDADERARRDLSALALVPLQIQRRRVDPIQCRPCRSAPLVAFLICRHDPSLRSLVVLVTRILLSRFNDPHEVFVQAATVGIPEAVECVLASCTVDDFSVTEALTRVCRNCCSGSGEASTLRTLMSEFRARNQNDLKKMGYRLLYSFSLASGNGHVNVAHEMLSDNFTRELILDACNDQLRASQRRFGWNNLYPWLFPLEMTCLDGQTAVVSEMLSQGINIHASLNIFGDTPLKVACYSGHYCLVHFLLTKGCHPVDESEAFAESHRSPSALFLACKNGHILVVRLLLKYGVDPCKDNWALETACFFGHAPVVELLLTRGVDVHWLDDLHLRTACYRGHADVVRVLLEHGADATGRLSSISTYPYSSGLTTEIDDHGVHERWRNKQRRWPCTLEVTGAEWYEDYTTKLLQDDYENTVPLRIAEIHEHEEVRDILLHYGAATKYQVDTDDDDVFS